MTLTMAVTVSVIIYGLLLIGIGIIVSDLRKGNPIGTIFPLIVVAYGLLAAWPWSYMVYDLM
ncbi:hypothetical protein SM033_00079 [Vibrio phage vB_VpaM_sm033]|nr:hypothetical protein SM033_00079 [Vibrio phage vB_VpaM_sm033]